MIEVLQSFKPSGDGGLVARVEVLPEVEHEGPLCLFCCLECGVRALGGGSELAELAREHFVLHGFVEKGSPNG